MDSSCAQVSDELAHVVWASNILSLGNPYTITASNKPLQPDQEVNDDDGVEIDDDPDQDSYSIDVELLTANGETPRRKFLDSICELLADTKGRNCVTAAALREKEDEVEVDIAQNNGLGVRDQTYLDLLRTFLNLQADGVSHRVLTEFLEHTILHTAGRVDSQAEAVAKLLKNSLYKPSQQSHLGEYTADKCLLGCCSAVQEPVFINAQALLLQFLNFDIWRSASLAKQVRDDRRRKIVELAATTTFSGQTTRATQEALKEMVPSVNAHKLIKMWRVLARPVSCLRILSKVARLLPNFRSVTFINLPRIVSLKLQRRQIINIQEAWRHLGLPFNSEGRIPPVLVQKNDEFRKKCRLDLLTHCEMQLLARYEAQPSLGPTLAYFGCSKKACYLCASYLALSPLQIRIRGRHGECHPRWAIQPNNSESVRQRVNKLCEMIKQKIVARLGPRRTPPPIAIQQSSAVSDLKSLDLLELTLQRRNQEAAEKNAQELREQRQILLNPRSLGPPVILYRDLRTLCVLCQAPCAKNCARCLAIWYCSKRCQTLDWPAHRLLCSKYRRFLDTRPSNDKRLGIWFPVDTDQPKLIWAPISSSEWGFHYPNFDANLGPNNNLLWTIPFKRNNRRGLELDHYLTIFYCDVGVGINESVQAAVKACPGMTVPWNMVGHYVVMSGQSGSYTGTSMHEFTDMTLADFRHALDWFSTYFDTAIRETPSAGSVLAVKISHPRENRLHGRELFTSVNVPYDFPSTSDVSPLSKVWGLPIRVCQLEDDDLHPATDFVDEEPEEKSWTNRFAQILMTSIDLKSENWGETRRGLDLDGSVLLIREDGEDLELAWAKHMTFYCLEVLKPLFDRALRGEISRQDVLNEIKIEKAVAWKPVDTSVSVAAGPIP